MPPTTTPVHNYEALTWSELQELYCYYLQQNWAQDALEQHAERTFGQELNPCRTQTYGSARRATGLTITFLSLISVLSFALISVVGYAIFWVVQRRREARAAQRRILRAFLKDARRNTHKYSRWQSERQARARAQSSPSGQSDETSESDMQEVCSICLEVLQQSHSVRVLRCTHFFHVACIRNWMKEHNSCPVCRAVVVIAEQLARANYAAMRRRTFVRGSHDEAVVPGARGVQRYAPAADGISRRDFYY